MTFDSSAFEALSERVVLGGVDLGEVLGRVLLGKGGGGGSIFRGQLLAVTATQESG